MAELLQRLVLTRAVATSDHRPARVLVLSVLRLDRLTVVTVSVSKGEVVRTPFDEQKDEERHRNHTAEVLVPVSLKICVLHD